MRLPHLLAAICALLLFTTSVATAQTTPSRGYVAVKGGLHAESAEDDLHGTTVGGGLLAGVHLSERWTLEGEFWIPGYLETGPFDGRHRDTLVGVAMKRSFGDRVRPHVLFGIDIGRTEDTFTTCGAVRATPGSPVPVPVLVSCDEPDVTERVTERFTSFSWFPLVGVGVEIPLTDRLVLIPDVRIQAWIGSALVRPAVAVGFAF